MNSIPDDVIFKMIEDLEKLLIKTMTGNRKWKIKDYDVSILHGKLGDGHTITIQKYNKVFRINSDKHFWLRPGTCLIGLEQYLKQ